VRETKYSSWLAGLIAWAKFLSILIALKNCWLLDREMAFFRFFGKAHVGGYTMAQNLIGLHDF